MSVHQWGSPVYRRVGPPWDVAWLGEAVGARVGQAVASCWVVSSGPGAAESERLVRAIPAYMCVN